MKLADVSFYEENGKLYIARTNKRGHPTQKKEITEEVIDWIVGNIGTSSFKKGEDVYLLAVRKADKEQLATMKIEDEVKKINRRKRGEAAYRKLQSLLGGMFRRSASDLGMMREFIKMNKGR